MEQEQTRSQILDNFQSVTGLKEIEQSIHYLTQYNWNLQAIIYDFCEHRGIFQSPDAPSAPPPPSPLTENSASLNTDYANGIVSFQQQQQFDRLIFHGTIEQAFDLSSNENRPLIIYLRNETSNKIYQQQQQILCSNLIIQYLIKTKFVICTCDLTLAQNRQRLMATFQKYIGTFETIKIHSYPSEMFPLLFILSTCNSTEQENKFKIRGVIHLGGDEMVKCADDIYSQIVEIFEKYCSPVDNRQVWANIFTDL